MDLDRWHLWTFGERWYARLKKSSPPVVITAASEAEREQKIRAYLEHGRKALEEP